MNRPVKGGALTYISLQVFTGIHFFLTVEITNYFRLTRGDHLLIILSLQNKYIYINPNSWFLSSITKCKKNNLEDNIKTYHRD